MVLVNCSVFCNAADEAMGDVCFPLKVGNYWKYNLETSYNISSVDKKETQNIKEVEVLGIDKFDNMSIATIERKAYMGDITFFYVQSNNKIFLLTTNQLDSDLIYGNTKILSSLTPDFLLPIEERKEEKIKVGDKIIVYSVKKSQVTKVPAGIFKNCLLVTIIDSHSNVQKNWLYPNVGLIKSEFKSADGNVKVVNELKEYEVIP